MLDWSAGMEYWNGVTGMDSLEWTGLHLGILSWREAHGSRGRKAMARGG